MDITLKQLRAFVTVANLGQFTLAADKLGSSQSAVSTLVRQLEANLNLRLFDRHTRLLGDHGSTLYVVERLEPELSGAVGNDGPSAERARRSRE